MRAIVFDTELSSLIFEDEVNTLRLCYLIADSICVGGHAGANFHFERDGKDFNLKKKVLCLINSENASDSPHKELTMNVLNYFLLDIKDMKATKHPSMTRLTPYNNVVRNFTKYYNEQYDNFIDYWRNCGYLDIISLLNEDNIIYTTLLEFSVGEWSQTLKSAPSNAKKILSELFPKSFSAPSISVFPKEFLIDKYADSLTDDFMIISTISFPDTDSLTALQLKVVREQLKESGQLFRTNLDEWLITFDSKEMILDSNYPQHKQLEESLQIFQSGINTNQILFDNQFIFGLAAENFNIKIGITTIQRVWNYYRQYKILDEFTLDEIIKQTSDHDLYPEFLPFMCISPIENEFKKKKDELNNGIENGISTMHKRKFLEL